MPITTTRVAQWLDTLAHCLPQAPDPLLRPFLLTWFDYYKCLPILLKRHQACQAVYAAALRRHRTLPPALATGADRRRAAAHDLRQWIETLRVACGRESASFMVFTQVVLDGLAATFFWYFALPCPRSEATHARLLQQFRACCHARALVCPHEEVLRLMQEVHTWLAAHAPTWQPPEGEDLTAGLMRVEHYIIAMLEVLEQNVGQSVCCRPPRAPILAPLPSTERLG